MSSALPNASRKAETDYHILDVIGEGAHGTVLRGVHKSTGQIVALKRLSRYAARGTRQTPAQKAIHLQREVHCLKQCIGHPHIIQLHRVYDVASEPLTLIMEHVPISLANVLEHIHLEEKHEKALIQMLLQGVLALHQRHILHRDLKPANLLLRPSDGCLKIADFGQARIWHAGASCRADPLTSTPLSHEVATRWYRAPELLFGSVSYDASVDIWAVGCIIAHIFNLTPLFPGRNDIDQIVTVFDKLGSPTDETWPGRQNLPDWDKIGFRTAEGSTWAQLLPERSAEERHIVQQCLMYDPVKRISAQQALEHPYFPAEPMPARLQLCASDLSPANVFQIFPAIDDVWKKMVQGISSI